MSLSASGGKKRRRPFLAPLNKLCFLGISMFYLLVVYGVLYYSISGALWELMEFNHCTTVYFILMVSSPAGTAVSNTADSDRRPGVWRSPQKRCGSTVEPSGGAGELLYLVLWLLAHLISSLLDFPSSPSA